MRRRSNCSATSYQIRAWPGYERGEARQELTRLEQQVRGAVAPCILELHHDTAVLEPRKAILCDRWSQQIPREPLEAIAVVGFDWAAQPVERDHTRAYRDALRDKP